MQNTFFIHNDKLKLSAVEFGRELVETLDLDPIYVMLNCARLEEDVLAGWLVAYWLFYHAGVASWCVDGEPGTFWPRVVDHVVLSGNQGGVRGTERRHFRGQKALDAIRALVFRFPRPIHMVQFLLGGAPRTSGAVIERAVTLPQFGPWVAFKVADMLNTVWGAEVNFTDCNLDIYDEPLKGGFIIDKLENHKRTLQQAERDWLTCPKDIKVIGMEAAEYLLASHLGRIFEPHMSPRNVRTLGIQEFETIMCKYKSYLNNHYWIGKDIHEIHEGLSDPNWGSLSKRLSKYLPKSVNKGRHP